MFPCRTSFFCKYFGKGLSVSDKLTSVSDVFLKSLGSKRGTFEVESERQTPGNFVGVMGKNKCQHGGPSTLLWDFPPGDVCMCDGDFQGSPPD